MAPRHNLRSIIFACVEFSLVLYSVQFTSQTLKMTSESKVDTIYGPIVGKTASSNGKVYHEFLGIPYAKQPLGDLRFRDPQPLEPWTEVLNATNENTDAWQINLLHQDGPTLTGTDNCLMLNIFSPDLTGRLPVYVSFHSGGFGIGSSSKVLYGPEYFMEMDILVVTVNHRLGLFGFMSFADERVGIPGNAGLKDQYMALKWIKENIACFGGDPDNITLGGISAGGASVQYHMISPMSEGLFHRGILQSGSVYNTWASLPDAEHYEHELARMLGWNGEGGDMGAFEVIAATDAVTLVNVCNDLILGFEPEKTVLGSCEFTAFLPRVEPYESEMCFLPKSFVELGREAWSKDMDIIIGGTKDEGVVLHAYYEKTAPVLENDFRLCVPNQLRQIICEEELSRAGSILKEIYFQENEVDLRSIEKYYEILADLSFWHGIHRTIRQREASDGNGKTFPYIVANTVDPENGYYKFLRKANGVPHFNGTCHLDDSPLTWTSIFDEKLTPESKVYSTSQQLLGVFVNFMKTGDPNCHNLGVQWKPTEEQEECNWLMFTDDGVKVDAPPHAEKMPKWDSIYKKNQLI